MTNPNAILTDENVNKQILSICDSLINEGKNAVIVKAYLQGKSNKNLTLLKNIGYDFDSKFTIQVKEQKALNTKLNNLTKLIRSSSLFNLCKVFNKFIAKPTLDNLQYILDADTNRDDKIKLNSLINSINPELINTIKEALSKKDLTLLPLFMLINHNESLTNMPHNDEPLNVSISFDVVKDFADNADMQSIELAIKYLQDKLNQTQKAA